MIFVKPQNPKREIANVERRCRAGERCPPHLLSDKRSQGLDDSILKKYEREPGRFQDFLSSPTKFN
jgi:hypothetical protein